MEGKRTVRASSSPRDDDDDESALALCIDRRIIHSHELRITSKQAK